MNDNTSPNAYIEQLRQELAQRGTVREFYLDLALLTTTTAPGFDERSCVDYLYVAPDGSIRLFDENDAGHELEQQHPGLLASILVNVQATQSPHGHALID